MELDCCRDFFLLYNRENLEYLGLVQYFAYQIDTKLLALKHSAVQPSRHLSRKYEIRNQLNLSKIKTSSLAF